MKWPDELRDQSRASAWFNKLLRACISHSLVESADLALSEGTHGTTARVRINPGGGGSTVNQYRPKSIENDFYTCRLWNGTTEGTEDVFIARPFEHRVSDWDGRSLAYNSDGDSFTAVYAYSSATKRTKTIAGTAETQVLVPYFKTDFDLIYAIRVNQSITVGAGFSVLTDPNGDPIRLLDLNVAGRAWAKLETV